ncbi:MAG TPA: RdgB/HAM1 family non-canonical purine NTP pyrophosphatase [Tepidisphaeraceae bacterium]|nr:RdgB/HAM1 family non-canonical purine NTP pyrophosphatase [Tepidisphaeraceae bacterium]
MRILIATMNPGKIREFREILGGDGMEWDDLSAHKGLASPEETGETFRANACLKASYYAQLLKSYAVADDSGLEVDALEGRPGVHSARWAELNQAGRGDADNNALLLKQLAGVPDEKRGARFVCVLALADPEGRILLTARDTVEGRVIHEARGNNGFGYDPLFLIDELGKTTAELSSDQKHQISHRGKALRRLRELMKEIRERIAG